MPALSDRAAYALKMRFPRLFRSLARGAEIVTGLRFRRRIAAARAHAEIAGCIDGHPARIRPLSVDDADRLGEYFARVPGPRLEFFRPHDFGEASLRRVLDSGAYSCYGIFQGESIVAYCVLKLSPSGAGYIGLYVDDSMSGRGLGRFIVHFLYWQASIAGLRTRSTISRDNVASIRCHEAVSPFEVVATFENNYQMIEFPQQPVQPPVLDA